MRDTEALRNHLDAALALERWRGLAARRSDFAGAEGGIDEEASFRGPSRALGKEKRHLWEVRVRPLRGHLDEGPPLQGGLRH